MKLNNKAKKLSYSCILMLFLILSWDVFSINTKIMRKKKISKSNTTSKVKNVSSRKTQRKAHKKGGLNPEVKYWLTFILGTMSQLPMVSAFGGLIEAAMSGSISIVCDSGSRDLTSYLPPDAPEFDKEKITEEFIASAVSEAQSQLDDKITSKMDKYEEDFQKKYAAKNKGKKMVIKPNASLQQYVKLFDKEMGKQIEDEETWENKLELIKSWVIDLDGKKKVSDCKGKYKSDGSLGGIFSKNKDCDALVTMRRYCILDMNQDDSNYADYLIEQSKNNKEKGMRIKKIYPKSTGKYILIYEDGMKVSLGNDLFKANDYKDYIEHYKEKTILDCTVEQLRILKLLKHIDKPKPIEPSKVTKVSRAFQIGFYLLKQMWLCSSTLVAEKITEAIFEYAGMWIISTLLNFLTGAIFYVLRLIYYVGKILYYLYKGFKADKEPEKEAEYFGKGLGAGIKFLLVAFGLAKKK